MATAKKKKASKKVTAKAKAPVKASKSKTASKPAGKAKAKAAPERDSFDTVSIDKVAQGVDKPRSKSDILRILSESTGLAKKDVHRILDRLSQLINLDIGKKGPGIFTLPGLVKIVRVMKPATKARKGVNPFTGQETTFKAKPARNVVKVRALKGLKEMV